MSGFAFTRLVRLATPLEHGERLRDHFRAQKYYHLDPVFRIGEPQVLNREVAGDGRAAFNFLRPDLDRLHPALLLMMLPLVMDRRRRAGKASEVAA